MDILLTPLASCGSDSKITPQKKHFGRYWCGECPEHCTVLSGTPMEYGKVGPRKWRYASYLLLTARKGISAMQLSKEIDVHYATAWCILHRSRMACDHHREALDGMVEMDVTYIGGNDQNRHESQKAKAGRRTIGPQSAIGISERDGRTKLVGVESENSETVKEPVDAHIGKNVTIFTDEISAYNLASQARLNHKRINHSAKKFVNGMASTNSIERVRDVLKRGCSGVHHNWSAKHCQA